MDDNNSATVDKKLLKELKDERHASMIVLLVCFLITFAFLMGIYLFGKNLIFVSNWHIILKGQTGILPYIVDIIFMIVWIWGTVWMFKVDGVKLNYIRILNKTIRAGNKGNAVKFYRSKIISDEAYKRNTQKYPAPNDGRIFFSRAGAFSNAV